MNQLNPRSIAALVLSQVNQGHSLNDALPAQLAKFSDKRDQAFVQALCYGVCRYYFRLTAVLALLLKKPLKVKDQDIYHLMLIGLYQLLEMRVSPHAAVAETVNATKYFKKVWAKGLVNAVLRNFLRHQTTLEQKISQNLEASFLHPLWMLYKIRKDWPNDWETILTANNEHPPFALRVNCQKISRKDYLKKIAPLRGTLIPETSQGIILDSAINVEDLIGFKEGEFSVQDGAAQLAAELLQLEPKLRVLDACAAPGGKTTHILEIEKELECLIAIDQSQTRLNSVRENLCRLQLQATCFCVDAKNTEAWWDKKLFDRILLDAPCSATGVIRRHPDIKLLRKETDIPSLAKQQYELLKQLWPLLKADGLLVYVTCSIFNEENVDTLKFFLDQHPDAKEEKILANWGKACMIGRQTLPGMHSMDGFYFACLRKC